MRNDCIQAQCATIVDSIHSSVAEGSDAQLASILTPAGSLSCLGSATNPRLHGGPALTAVVRLSFRFWNLFETLCSMRPKIYANYTRLYEDCSMPKENQMYHEMEMLVDSTNDTACDVDVLKLGCSTRKWGLFSMTTLVKS